MGSGFREAFWKMMEPQLSLKGRKTKKEEGKIFFFEKMKIENKEH